MHTHTHDKMSDSVGAALGQLRHTWGREAFLDGAPVRIAPLPRLRLNCGKEATSDLRLR